MAKWDGMPSSISSCYDATRLRGFILQFSNNESCCGCNACRKMQKLTNLKIHSVRNVEYFKARYLYYEWNPTKNTECILLFISCSSYKNETYQLIYVQQ